MVYNVEVTREIWDDEHGNCVEVGPDRDGLGMVEIRYRCDDGKIGARLAFPTDLARLVLQAMLVCADELDATKEAK